MRVLLADDHALLRAGVRAVLDNLPSVTVIGECSNGREAVQETRRLEPDLVIMDVAMPELNGAEATQRIVAATPGVKVLALSMHDDARYVQRMFQAGASGYLLKDCAAEELEAAIDALRTSGAYLSPGITGVVIGDYVRRIGDTAPTAPELSTREREVLQLIAEGHTTAGIATRLTVSVKTVESHRKRLMDKLEMRSVAELTRFAVREGIVPIDS